MSQEQTNESAENPWPVYGHRWAVQLLRNTVYTSSSATAQDASGPNHAYLLTGPRHLGKSTLARVYAQALLCEGTVAAQDDIPCNECRACRLMGNSAHPDFRHVQPIDQRGEVDRLNGQLRVDQATDLVREVAIRPLEGRYKIFLIQDFHRANDRFANKVLKTLEEPPAHVILLLTAEDRTLLLPTIVSRCQVLTLRPLDRETVHQALTERWQVPEERATLLARLSNGCLGWAVNGLKDDDYLVNRNEGLANLQQLIEAGNVDRLAYAAKLATERNNEHIFGLLDLWTGWWRDVMLTQSGCADACSNIDHHEALASQAAQVPASTVRDYLQTLQQLEGYLHHTVNVRLALDVLLLKLPSTSM